MCLNTSCTLARWLLRDTQLTSRIPLLSSPSPSFSLSNVWCGSLVLSAVLGLASKTRPGRVVRAAAGLHTQVLVSDIKSSLRRLMDDISEDNWMYDPIDLGQGHQHGR